MTGTASWRPGRRAGAEPLRRIGWALALVAAQACRPSGDVLVVYTGFTGPVVQEVERGFEEAEPRWDVRMVALSDDEVLARLTSERDRVQADVWWGADVRALHAAAAAGLLAVPGGAGGAAGPAWPAALRAGAVSPDSAWAVAYVRPWALAFSTERVPRSRAPRDWIDLLHPRWAGSLVLPDPQTDPGARWLLGSLALHEVRRTGDVEAGFDFLARLEEIVGGYAEDGREILRMLRAGEADLAVLPAPVALAAREDRPWLAVRMLDGGSPADVRGVAVPQGAPRPDGAAAFLSYLASGAGAAAVERAGGWWPPERVWPAGETSSTAEVAAPSPWDAAGPARLWPLSLDTLPAELDAWMDRWSREIRGRRTMQSPGLPR